MLYDDYYHSRVCTAPGALTVCGQDVLSLSWHTRSPEVDDNLFHLFDPTRTGGLHLSHRDFKKLLADLEPPSVIYLAIQTAGKLCQLEPYTGSITVTLSGGQTFSCTATPPFSASESRVSQVADTALYLLEAGSMRDLEVKLLKMSVLGMASLPEGWTPSGGTAQKGDGLQQP